MRRVLLFLLIAVSACKADPPPEPVAITIDPAAFSLIAGGYPNEEVALDFYKTLTTWAKEYPPLRPAIAEAIQNDGIITYSEFSRLSKMEEPLALAEGQKQWDKEAEPYRQQVKEASKS